MDGDNRNREENVTEEVHFSEKESGAQRDELLS
jgi:hypothetical protein